MDKENAEKEERGNPLRNNPLNQTKVAMLRFFNFLRSWHYAIRPIFGPKNFISAQIFEEGEAKEGDINEGQEIKIKALIGHPCEKL